ncbi:MAG: NUDIX hydrolase [Anaerolineaceae bacterium]|jgi:ADP-ribose pyrophosphatase|nr:NUDIX hydrolase [Anaerolineaceae bacterium]HPT23215.1 NUDIX hydrolase [Anaerolineaceae bacterium]
MEPRYKLISREKVLEAHAFDVERIIFQLPDGKQRTYDLVDHANAVTLVPIDRQGNVYFVTQYRLGAEALVLELPAGVMDEGEMPVETARRELREEIGMDCRELISLGGMYMVAGYSNEYMNLFLASDLLPSPLEQDEDEFLTLSIIPIRQVFKMVREGVIQDGKTLCALFLAQPWLLKKYPDLLAD